MFETKADRPQWAIVYDRLAGMDVGEIVKDEELFGLLPDAPESSVRSAFYRAVRELEDANHRTLDRVRTVGYRVVDAPEHERLARGQHKKAKRRLKAANSRAHSADRTRLNPDERRRLDAIEDHLGRQQEMVRRLDARVEKTEQRTARTEKDTAQLADKLDELRDLLRRHGIDDDKDQTEN